ncbi:MAG: HD-GYP domain-containing protein [Bacillota bacterium]
MNDGKINISLNQLLSSLSIALDLAQNRSFEHSRRTAYISLMLSQKMGLDSETMTDIYFASLLHDIGMSGNLSRFSIDEFHTDKDLKRLHSARGADIVKNLPLSQRIGKYILFHHDDWDGTGIHRLKGNEIPIGSQIIHLADNIELMYSRQCSVSKTKEKILQYVEAEAGKQFHPDIVDSFLTLSRSEKFWMDMMDHHIYMVLNKIEPIQMATIDMDGMEKIAQAFAILIDNKSEFTYSHSQGIAHISREMGKSLGFEALKWRKIGVAAYMHDLGKLAVPNEILDKPGKLTAQEYQIIKSHPYYTKLIIGQVEGCEDIAEWAGNHHERVDGTGYPECLHKRELTIEDQIIAAADVYQALTEDRPYRKGLKKADAVKILHDMVKSGQIRKDAFDCLEAVV